MQPPPQTDNSSMNTPQPNTNTNNNTYNNNTKFPDPPEFKTPIQQRTTSRHVPQVSTLLSNLEIGDWNYSDTALIEALKLRTETEKTKQETIKLEKHNKILEILNHASQLGIPGTEIHKLFDNELNTPFDNSSPGSINASGIHSQIFNPVFPPPMLGQPGPIQQSIKPSLGSMHQPLNSTQLAPLNENVPRLPPFYPGTVNQSQMTSPTNDSRNTTINSEQFTPMHRSTMSGFNSGSLVDAPNPNILVSPVNVNDGLQQNFSFPKNFSSPRGNVMGAGSPQMVQNSYMNSNSSQNFQQSPMQQSSMQQHMQQPGNNTTLSPTHPQFGLSKQKLTYPPPVQLPDVQPKHHRPKVHRKAASASDLQIYQWNPDQINLDNRWKIGSPKVKESSSHYSSGSPTKSTASGVSGHTRKTSSSSAHSAQIVAAHNNKRRSAGIKRKSASSQVVPPPVQPPSNSSPQHEGAPSSADNMSVLASVAGEQSKTDLSRQGSPQR